MVRQQSGCRSNTQTAVGFSQLSRRCRAEGRTGRDACGAVARIPQCGNGMLSAGDDFRTDIRRPERELKSGQQAIPHPCHVAGGFQPPSRQGATEGHGRTRPRPRRRTGHCRKRGGGWDTNQIGNSTPCTWICAGPKRCGARKNAGTGRPASRQRWQTVGAECTAARHRAHPKGNRNAFKHGRYSAETIARRREISALIRAGRAFGGKTVV